ncbi:unnamed protein product [Medioppia subpectinata]|uniref:FERM adjacent domain-containing protein n=1 Tax=Medioppia subpectinata TaxID=1979941 RepID=A0A7R9KV14_9ACAR|nr:unnamed protein product [Medioppia subpectinata]CAG2110396.1 unnamed protein product [Medioppia subpectinata]
MSPEPPPKQKLFLPRFGSKFRYSGKTFYQTRIDSERIDRPPLNFQRTLSNRRLTTRSMDGAFGYERYRTPVELRPDESKSRTISGQRVYDSDRSSRDEKVRSGTGISSTTATTPESIGGKTPSLDSGGEETERRHRRPIGGVAVLPPMEMRRIEEQRRSPIERPLSKSPAIPEESKYNEERSPTKHTYSKTSATSPKSKVTPTKREEFLNETNKLVRSGTGISSTTATTPESIGGKTPSLDSGGEETERRHRRPIGGVAVLPPMEMRRIEEQRRSPIERPLSKSPVIPEESKYNEERSPTKHTYSKTSATSPKSKVTPTKREEFLNETNKLVSESPLTSTPKGRPTQQSFDLKPAGNAFVKEYTYTEDDTDLRRPYSPREYGFTYSTDRKSGADISPIGKDELPSPTGKRLTGLAFTYKPPEKEKPSDRPAVSEWSKSPPQTKVKTEVPSKESTAIDRTKAQTRDKQVIGQTVAPKQSKLPVKASPTLVVLESETSDKRKSKDKSGIPLKSQQQRTVSQTSPKSVETGRTSRQSKDSKLDSSSSEGSVSSGSSMDVYEKETVKHDPTITATPVKTVTKADKSGADKSRIVSSQLSGPKITHASRKRVVTNADGTVEEMEEVLEPDMIGSLSTSKPIHDKTKRTQRSPQTGYPNVRETSKTASSSISSVSKKQTSGEEFGHERGGIHSTKKTSTTVEEEKSLSKHISQNTRLVSGTVDEVAPIVKTEKIKYSPSAQQSPLPTKSVPVIATETRKVAYTETRPTAKQTQDSHTSPSALNLSTATPPPPPQFANDNSAGTSPTNGVAAPVGDVVSSQTVSSKTRTVETITYKMEKDGVVETRVEQKITIQSDGDPIDHDRALADAIQEATMMNPDMTVEKIEIQQQSSIQ